jgi:hypothetical protein
MRAVSSLMRRWCAPSLELGPDELFKFCAHVGGDFYLIATELLRDIDGLLIRAQEVNAGWTIVKMVVKPTFYVRFQAPLNVFKQQPFNVATPEHRSKKPTENIHLRLRCCCPKGRFARSKYFE